MMSRKIITKYDLAHCRGALSLGVAGLVSVMIYFSSDVLSATAEFQCESEVHYSWAAKEVATPAAQGAPAKDKAKEKEPAEEGAKKDKGLVKEVFWSAVTGAGATEDEAKAKLKILVTEERAKADWACKDAHENQTKCVATKYAQTSSTFQLMGFAQRKEFEKKINADCEQASGSCSGSSATEAACKENKPAEAPAVAADAGKGKDSKKK